MTLTLLVAIKVLTLSFVANTAPILGTRLLGHRWSWPIDGGLQFTDGRPLLGNSKTVRGLLLSVFGCAIAAVLLGERWQLGVSFGCATMVGDALSSFIKRRLAIPSSGRCIGVDQIPEILLPLLVCADELRLDVYSIILLTGLFWIGSLGVSRLAFQLGLKKRPY
jgi:CDP-2,3-bis-(O-geranylgeranyl)-sn-glycerol synthase